MPITLFTGNYSFVNSLIIHDSGITLLTRVDAVLLQSFWQLRPGTIM